MKIVIDIPEEDYIRLRDEGMFGNVTTFKRAVREGIPLEEQEPCTDAISRQAMIEVLNKMDRYVADELTLCDTERKFPQNEVFIVDDVYEEIVEQLPPITPVEKVGQWERNQYDGNSKIGNFHCSLCLGIGRAHYSYCPYCGAKMQEVEE